MYNYDYYSPQAWVGTTARVGGLREAAALFSLCLIADFQMSLSLSLYPTLSLTLSRSRSFLLSLSFSLSPSLPLSLRASYLFTIIHRVLIVVITVILLILILIISVTSLRRQRRAPAARRAPEIRARGGSCLDVCVYYVLVNDASCMYFVFVCVCLLSLIHPYIRARGASTVLASRPTASHPLV